MNHKEKIIRCNSLLKKWKVGTITDTEKIGVRILLNDLQKEKEKSGDLWGSLVITGMLVQMNNFK